MSPTPRPSTAGAQRARLRVLLRDRRWRTTRELADAIGASPPTVRSRLREIPGVVRELAGNESIWRILP